MKFQNLLFFSLNLTSKILLFLMAHHCNVAAENETVKFWTLYHESSPSKK